MHQDVMDMARLPSLLGLLIGTIILSQTVPTTFAFDRPIHTSFALLVTCGAAVLSFSRFLPRDKVHIRNGRSFEATPLSEIGQSHSPRPSSTTRGDVAYPSTLRKLRIVVMILLVVVLLRTAVINHTLTSTQCRRTYLEPLILLVFAIWDYWTVQRVRKAWIKATKHDDDNEAVSGSRLETPMQFFSCRPYLHLVSAALVSIGSLLALDAIGTPSTSICAVLPNRHWQIWVLQYFGFSLDIAMVRCITWLLQQQEGRGHRSVALRFASVGWSLIASAIALLTVSPVYLFFSTRARPGNIDISLAYISDLSIIVLSAASIVVSALVMVYNSGVMTTMFLAGFFSVSTTTTSTAWNSLHAFPPTSLDEAYFGICLVIIGLVVYFGVGAASTQRAEGRRRDMFAEAPTIYLILFVLFMSWTSLWLVHKDVVNFHPIDKLIYEAPQYHVDYLSQSASSSTLNQAVETYRARYHTHPPPNFDVWYKFATKGQSVIIDNFDSIHRDLLPFYALSPSEIRQRTWELVSNPWNNVTGIKIRNGKVSILTEIDTRYRWEADGLVKHISKFSEHLPDMYLAFNINSEPRVVLPFESIQPKLQVGTTPNLPEKPDNAYSDHRAGQWRPISGESTGDTPFSSGSLGSSFFKFGSVACPKSSSARGQRIWDTSRLCLSCTAPQSLGAILSNWSVAADVCHQPDLVNLHELYTSAAGFKATHSLHPVFSHAKIHGFSDIMYPSTWDYLEKTKYAPEKDIPDPKFSLKNTTLFWRDTISTDPAPGPSQWQGMMRQRFIHLTNKYPSSSELTQSILLPESLSSPSRGGKRLRYHPFPISKLTDLLPTDIHHTSSPLTEPCADQNCESQALFLGPPFPAIDFQSHWQYKYLLDLDSTAPSRNFLPFLRSRSLPFKAGLFREWYSDRLTPWLHFVPLDIRGHGLWATLAWFTGLRGEVEVGGRLRRVRMDGHARDAERIADKGREWASVALRREDMEIYFFRLLLEWGRLTDDRREELGFEVVEEG